MLYGEEKKKMNDKLITVLLAILIALSGWSLTTTVGLKSEVAVLKEKVSGIENEVQDFKAFSKKKTRKKKNKKN
jgi:prophage DNA circulation protein